MAAEDDDDDAIKRNFFLIKIMKFLLFFLLNCELHGQRRGMFCCFNFFFIWSSDTSSSATHPMDHNVLTTFLAFQLGRRGWTGSLLNAAAVRNELSSASKCPRSTSPCN